MEPADRKILIVDDDPAQLRLLEKLLPAGMYEILRATNGRDALQTVLSEGPRVIITDWMMPEMNGLELCRALRQHEGVRFIYVIMVTGQTGADKLAEAFEAGADDFIAKPISRGELIARLRAAERIVGLESDLAKRTREIHRVNAEMAMAHRQLNRANDRLTLMATTDELTGLTNRREAMNRLEEMWSAQDRYGQTYSCIMIDIDYFKRFNDNHGHAAGDRILKETADLLIKNTRKTDKVCRIGGEEFLILCPNVDLDGATVCAEHLKAAVDQHRFEYEGTGLHVTISLGVARRMEGMVAPDDLLKAADVAMYESKALGRNRVTVASERSSLKQ